MVIRVYSLELILVQNVQYNDLKVKPSILPSKAPMKGLFGPPRMAPGCVLLPVVYKDMHYKLKCQLVNENMPNFLSESDSENLKLVQRVYHVNSTDSKVIVDEFKHVFQGVGKLPGQYSLKTDPSILPIAHNPRPVPAALYGATKA